MLLRARETHAPIVEGEGEKAFAGEPLGERRIEGLRNAHGGDEEDGAAAVGAGTRPRKGAEDSRHDALPAGQLDSAALERLALHVPESTAAGVPSQARER